MSARINFFQMETEKKTIPSVMSVTLPNTALVMKDGRRIVYTVENNKTRAIEITIGKTLGNLTEITNGIKAGQEVVLSPPSNLKSGDKVKIIE